MAVVAGSGGVCLFHRAQRSEGKKKGPGRFSVSGKGIKEATEVLHSCFAKNEELPPFS